MPRAASRLLDLFACALACALGCGPSAPPNTPTPASAQPRREAEPPPEQALVIQGGGPIPDARLPAFIEACAAGKLDDANTAALVQHLEATRDVRGEPCFIRALQDYLPEVNEETVGLAARALGELKRRAASEPLLEVFTKIQASKPRVATSRCYRDVADAMEELLDPGWEPQLIALVGRPVDAKAPATVTDEMYWQITAAKLLGLMKSSGAVKPLIKMVLSPAKAAGQITSILALVKIGKPAIDPLVALLKGDDKNLVEYGRTEQLKAANGDKQAEKFAANAHIATAALILATIGRDETAAPLIEAIGKADDASRAVIARELTKLPKSAATMKAFQDAFEKTPPSLTLPGTGQGAREALLEAAGSFYDPSLVPWIVKQARAMKGDDSDLDPIREASFIAVLKLATADQLKFVDELGRTKVTVEGKASTVGKGFDKEIKATRETLAACGDRVDCYLGKMTDPSSQKENNQFVAIKSAYMIGVLGNADVRRKLLDVMPKLHNPAVRFLSVSLLDFFSPKGDAAIAEQLQKIVKAGEKDPDQQRLNAAFPTVIYRLVARAQ